MAGTNRISARVTASRGQKVGQVLAQTQNSLKLASPELVVLNDASSPAAEAIRSLYAQLEQKVLPHGRNGFAVIADGPGRGATFVAANLSLTFAQSGYRTALIDTNLSTPRVGSLFEIDPQVLGLSDWIADIDSSRPRRRYGEAPYPNLGVLPSGTAQGRSDLLLSRAMGTIMAELPRLFDVVIYDTPDATETAAALALAGKADQTILVCRAHVTKAVGLSNLEKRVSESGGAVAGIVLSEF